MKTGNSKRLDLMKDINYIVKKVNKEDVLNNTDFSEIIDFCKRENVDFKFYDNINIFSNSEILAGVAVNNTIKKLPEEYSYAKLASGVYVFNQFHLSGRNNLVSKINEIEKELTNYLSLIEIPRKDEVKFLRMVVEPHGNSYQVFYRVGDPGEY